MASRAIRLASALALTGFVAACTLLPRASTAESGCEALGFNERRCNAVVARARDEAGGRPVPVTGVTVLLPTDDGSVRLGGQMIARVRFDFADGSNVIQEVWCKVSLEDDIACRDNPEIMLFAGIDHDVPCSGEAGNGDPAGCATPVPTPPPAAVAAAKPVRVPVLDIPLDHTGPYEIRVGSAGLPNGYLTQRHFDIADHSPTTFWISGGIRLDVRPTIDGRPEVGSVYRKPFDGTEPVEVFLVFDVTETRPGAVLQVRDLVVE
jgi:hypothetical protein